MPVKLGTGTIHFKCVSSCFYKCFFFFFLFCTSISCNWSDSHRHLCCLDTQYVMDARKLCVFPPLSICICTFPHKDFSSSHFSFFFYLFFEEESLNFTNIPCYLYSALNHLTAVKLKKKKIQMARHPFKNPLKALVTF